MVTWSSHECIVSMPTADKFPEDHQLCDVLERCNVLVIEKKKFDFRSEVTEQDLRHLSKVHVLNSSLMTQILKSMSFSHVAWTFTCNWMLYELSMLFKAIWIPIRVLVCLI